MFRPLTPTKTTAESNVIEAPDSDDDSDIEEEGGVPLPHPPQNQHVHPSPTTTNDPPQDPQTKGMQKARQRELVRQAARRLGAFGVPSTSSLPTSSTSKDEARKGKVGRRRRGDGEGEGEDQGERRRRVEAVQNGRVVEASFAKGEWGVRWKS